MDAIFADGQFWQAIGYVIGALLALLLAAVVARYSAKFGRETWLELRGQMPLIISAVDEPSDPIIMLIDRYVPGKADVALAAFMSAGLRALGEMLDRSLDVTPPVERNLNDATPH